MASEAEQVKIANGFLMSAPPGEFVEVVTDVRSILPRESMLNDTAPQTFKEYNQDQMIQADAQDGSHRFLITRYNEVAPNQYLDHQGGLVATFDHIKSAVTSARPIAPADLAEPGLEETRAGVEKAVAQYVSDQYPHGTCGVFAGKGELYVCITSTRLNPQNYWNGRWRSVWTVPLKGGNLSGRVRLQVHYYEDGNVQLHTDTTKKVPSPGMGDPAAVAKAISKCEQQFHQALDSSYNVMGETVLKALRRALPITGQKINWSSIQSYRVGQETANPK